MAPTIALQFRHTRYAEPARSAAAATIVAIGTLAARVATAATNSPAVSATVAKASEANSTARRDVTMRPIPASPFITIGAVMIAHSRFTAADQSPAAPIAAAPRKNPLHAFSKGDDSADSGLVGASHLH